MPFLGQLFDPLYWLLIGPTIILSIWAQWKVKSTFAKYSNVPSRSGIRGRDAAAAILRAAQVEGVTIERHEGHLTDHYHPLKKTLVLSQPVYDSSSIAALGVAAHEAGHAIQHKGKYLPLVVRSAWVPVASYGSFLGPLIITIGFVLMGMAKGADSTWGPMLVKTGIWLFAAMAFFTVVTLPVEFNASARAVRILKESGIVTSEAEEQGVRAVLNAAAMTYVAAAAAAVMQLIYYIMIFNRRRD